MVRSAQELFFQDGSQYILSLTLPESAPCTSSYDLLRASVAGN